MKIIIHRGTHQIGGSATEIRTENTRILIDMGHELGFESSFVPQPLHIPGVTDTNGSCDAVLFTHNHGDHIGQLSRIREDIPLYMGALAKAVYLFTSRMESPQTVQRICGAGEYTPGEPFLIGDMRITPFSVDHSACDSYMLLIEAEGKRLLHTGDFRLHGLRGKAIPKIIDKLVGNVDVLITEGTTLSRPVGEPTTEQELQRRAGEYMARYKYVFVYCAATNLERVCALAKAVPKGKYFICDETQSKLLDILSEHWGDYSPLYRNIKKTVYGDNLLPKFQDKGFLMMVRDNSRFRKIVPKFDQEQSIMLYSMWDGYRTRPGSGIPAFLDLAGSWESLHTSGHASPRDLGLLIEKCRPHLIVPIHTDCPTALKDLHPNRNVVIIKDKEELIVP